MSGQTEEPEKPKGFFGRVFGGGGGGKRFKAAKMGNKLEMYYNEELKCWVSPGEEEEKRKEIAALTAPPPTAFAPAPASSMGQNQTETDINTQSKTAVPNPSHATTSNEGSTTTGASLPPPNMGAPFLKRPSAVSSRYAPAPMLSVARDPVDSNNNSFNSSSLMPATSSSVFLGINPPMSFGAGAGAAPAVFKPAAVGHQPETAKEDQEQNQESPAAILPGGVEVVHPIHDDVQQHPLSTSSMPSLTADIDNTNKVSHENNDDDTIINNNIPYAQNTTPNNDDYIDPVTLEVLSFWSYYRKCGFEADAMSEWVAQNYDQEYADIDYETMLQDPRIMNAVEEHIHANKRENEMVGMDGAVESSGNFPSPALADEKDGGDKDDDDVTMMYTEQPPQQLSYSDQGNHAVHAFPPQAEFDQGHGLNDTTKDSDDPTLGQIIESMGGALKGFIADVIDPQFETASAPESETPSTPITNHQHHHPLTRHGVTPFSPGQLAADLGVPKDAVSMSALFAAEAASLGTLSSRAHSENEYEMDGHGDRITNDDGTAVENPSMMMTTISTTTKTTTVEEMVDVIAETRNEPKSVDEWGWGDEEEEMGLDTLHDMPVPHTAPDVQQHQNAANTTAAFTPGAALVVESWEAAAAAAAVVVEHPSSVGFVEDRGIQVIGNAADAAVTIAPSSTTTIRDLEATIEALKFQLEQATTALEASTNELEQARDDATKHSTSMAEILGAQQALANEKRGLEEEVERLRHELLRTQQARDEEKSSQEEEVERLRHELLRTQQARDEEKSSQEEEVERLRDQVNQRVPELEDRCRQLEASTLEAKQSASALLAERDELAAAVAALKEEKASMPPGIDIALLQAECDEVKAALDAKDNEIEDLKAALELKNDAIAELRAQRDQSKDREASLVSSLNDMAGTKESELRALHQQLAHALHQVEGLEAEKVEAEASRASLEAQLEQVRADVHRAESRAMEAETEMAQTRAQLTQEAAKCKELERKVIVAKKKIVAQQTQQEAMAKELETLRSSQMAKEAASADKEHELATMAAALEEAQQAFARDAAMLKARFDELAASKAAEIQALAADNARLVQLLGEQEAAAEALSYEIQDLRESNANAKNELASKTRKEEEEVKVLSGEVEALRQEMSQWMAVAEDADARCTAAEEALAMEESARIEAANAAAHMQQQLSALQLTLASTEAQLSELAALHDDASHFHERHHNETQALLEDRIAALESELANAHATLQAIDRGGFEAAVEEAEELRTRLAAASQVAAVKEEELLKYKKQIVKLKKLRSIDAEKLASLQQQEDKKEEEPEKVKVLLEEIATLHEQLQALRSAWAESDQNMTEALSALGTEEAKVARLAELLVERGMPEDTVFDELSAVEDMLMAESSTVLDHNNNGGNGGGGGETSAVHGGGEEEDESLV